MLSKHFANQINPSIFRSNLNPMVAQTSDKEGPDKAKLAKIGKNTRIGAISGAISGFTARMAVAPLDVLKIRFQVQSETGGAYAYRTMIGAVRSIVANEGVLALWKGNTAALIMSTLYSSVQFSLIESMDDFESSSPLVRKLVSGGTAAAIATLTTYPLDLMRTRMAAEPKRYPTLTGTFNSVRTRYGFRGFYFGVVPTLVQITPYIALNYTAFQKGKEFVQQRRPNGKISTFDDLAIGATSGVVAKFVTMPLDTIKKRMQILGQFDAASKGYRHAAHAFQSIYAKEGVLGLFRGTMPSLVKAGPSSAVTFAAFEATKRFLESRNQTPK